MLWGTGQSEIRKEVVWNAMFALVLLSHIYYIAYAPQKLLRETEKLKIVLLELCDQKTTNLDAQKSVNGLSSDTRLMAMTN